MLPATPTRCAAMPGGGPADAERWAPSEPRSWPNGGTRLRNPATDLAGETPSSIRRHRPRPEPPSTSKASRETPSQTLGQACELGTRNIVSRADLYRAMPVSGVGRRRHRCAGTPSSGSSADFPGRQRASWRDLLRRVGSASCRLSSRRGEGRRRPGDPATRRPGDPATRRPGDPATRRPGDPPGSLTPTITVCIAWARDPGPRQVRGSCRTPCPLNPPCPCKQIGCSPAISPPDTRSEGA